ncbi:MAG: hypothetical protein GXP53_14040 [Deltaproteobacteria bacterium]|nr:hypothetical protein [Deltaproteobacteria bacterium]
MNDSDSDDSFIRIRLMTRDETDPKPCSHKSGGTALFVNQPQKPTA